MEEISKKYGRKYLFSDFEKKKEFLENRRKLWKFFIKFMKIRNVVL